MIPPKVKEVLDRYGLEALEFEPGSTPTATMAAARIGVDVGQIAKSILLRGKNGGYSMAVLPGDKRISNTKLKQIIGAKQSMASADEAVRETGFPPGGVCPFGVEGIAIYLDRGLESYPTIFPAAGNDATGVPMTFAQLREITGGTVCDLSE
jgi:prolyl-tRNA editing enzyme YbaK/EbsC (Cys-tRNA(Pro) deacylase)